MIALLAFLLLAVPAAAQRPACGYGLGLGALATAQRSLGTPPASLSTGREAAAAASQALAEAAGRFAGCGCPDAAAGARDAAGIAEQATIEPSLERLRSLLDRAGFFTRLARERLDRRGCG